MAVSDTGQVGAETAITRAALEAGAECFAELRDQADAIYAAGRIYEAMVAVAPNCRDGLEPRAQSRPSM